MKIIHDRIDNIPFPEATTLIYKKAFEKGLAWIPSGNTLRIASPLIMAHEIAKKGIMIIMEEVITETEQELNL